MTMEDTPILDSPDYAFKINEQGELLLYMPDDVFHPTGTTNALIKAAAGYLDGPGRLLDLGCGSGVLGIAMHRLGLVAGDLCASDLSAAAIACTQKNAAHHGCPADARCGSLFEPWDGEKFEIIIDDISGVAEEVAKASPWFHNVPCNSGPDGTTLVAEVIARAADYLAPGGRFFFPVISFSNMDKLVGLAEEAFSHVERLEHQAWPLPEEMHEHEALLKEQRDMGHVTFEEKFGMILWFTEVYVAYNK